MIRYGARAVPWPRVTAAACLVLLLMELVGRWPYSTWALQGGAVGLLAGASAWVMDEPAARLVDTAPRNLAWRTAARLPAVSALGLVWTAAVSRSWDGLGGHGRTVLLQGLAAIVVALAWTACRRSGGVATPGTAFAVGVVPAGLVWGMTRVSEWVPVLPYVGAPAEDWTASARGWTVAGLVALGLLALALADARWWRPRVRVRGVGAWWRDGSRTRSPGGQARRDRRADGRDGAEADRPGLDLVRQAGR